MSARGRSPQELVLSVQHTLTPDDRDYTTEVEGAQRLRAG